MRSRNVFLLALCQALGMAGPGTIVLLAQNGAFVLQFRFAAAESVEAPFAGRAISLVQLGGIAAGYLGPEIALRTQNWLPAGLYTGSFAALAILHAVGVIL